MLNPVGIIKAITAKICIVHGRKMADDTLNISAGYSNESSCEWADTGAVVKVVM